MSRYIRNFDPGGTFFVTVNAAERGGDLLVRHIDELRNAVRITRGQRPFEIVAWVVLPDHLHAIWTLPENDTDYSTRWAAIKSRFSRSVAKTERISDSRLKKEERGIWQRRFWEHTIRDERDLENHVNYVHINPVKHGLVERASAWPHSTIHAYIRRGLVNEKWACDDVGKTYAHDVGAWVG